METQDKQNVKKKAFVISSLMKNPKLAQSLFDSWDAPAGSTKNTKAKSLLYSMKKATDIHDGKGGPGFGDWWESNVVSPLQGVGQGIRSGIDQAFDPSKSLTVPGTPAYEKAQEAKTQNVQFIRGVDDMLQHVETGVAEETKWSGEKSLGANILGRGFVAGQALPKSLAKGAEFSTGMVGSTLYPWLAGTEWAARTGLGNVLSIFGPSKDIGKMTPEYEDLLTVKAKEALFGDDKKDLQKKYYRVTGTDEVYDKISKTHITAEQAAKIPDFWNQVEEIPEVSTKGAEIVQGRKTITVQGRKVFADTGEFVTKTDVLKTQETSDDLYRRMILSGQDPTAAEYEAKWQTGFDPNVEAVNRDLKKNPNYNPDFGSNTFKENPEDADEIFDNLDDSEKDFWGPSYEISKIGSIEEAVELGLGSEFYANQILSDPKQLGEMLGLSEEQTKALPEGMLQEQLFDLKDALNNEYRIDEQRDELYRANERDLDITDKFITYIHNKDEYLNEISELLKGVEKKIAYMDTSNPYVAKRMQSYVNYLTILQGRQNQRYIDFLDSGIKHHKNEMDSLDLSYKRSKEAFDEKWLGVEAKRTENYNVMKTALESMYNIVEAKNRSQGEIDEWEWKQVRAAEIQLDMVLENAKIEAMMSGGTGIEVNASTAKMFKDMYMHEENDDGTINFSTYNPNEVRNSASLAIQNEQYAVNSFMKDMGYTVSKSVEAGSLNQFERFKKSMISNLANNIEKLPEITQEEYNNMSQEEKIKYASNDLYINDFGMMNSKLQVNLQAGLKNYFSSTEEKILKLREAITELSNIEGFKYGKAWGYSKEKFIDEYGETFGEFAEKLYDFTAFGVSEGRSDQKREGQKETFTSADFWASDEGKTGDELINDFTNVFVPYLMY